LLVVVEGIEESIKLLAAAAVELEVIALLLMQQVVEVL
jgi:hypothetical protein